MGVELHNADTRAAKLTRYYSLIDLLTDAEITRHHETYPGFFIDQLDAAIADCERILAHRTDQE